MGAFENESLQAHNNYRAKHGVSPLQLDNEMCKYAAEWAQYLARSGSFQHRNNNKYGENIFMSYGQEVNGSSAVNAWYAEIKNYNFQRGGFSSNTGHFTQVVWRDSKKLGVGYATSGGKTFVVANYDPPGNFQGRYQENVSPLRG